MHHPLMPVLREVLTPMFAFWRMVGDLLAEPWAAEENGGLFRAGIGHAIAFQTWQSLVRNEGIEDGAAVTLMLGMICAVARQPHCG